MRAGVFGVIVVDDDDDTPYTPQQKHLLYATLTKDLWGVSVCEKRTITQATARHTSLCTKRLQHSTHRALPTATTTNNTDRCVVCACGRARVVSPETVRSPYINFEHSLGLFARSKAPWGRVVNTNFRFIFSLGTRRVVANFMRDLGARETRLGTRRFRFMVVRIWAEITRIVLCTRELAVLSALVLGRVSVFFRAPEVMVFG